MGRGTHRGFITYEELNKSLGKRNLSDENLSQAFIHILDEGVALVEKKSDFKVLRKKENSSKEEGKTIEKSDDPIRMYLREMGGVELLSREGEIAIAKRIEAGKDVMLIALSQSPMTAQQFYEWNDQLQKDEILVREIIDIDTNYMEDESTGPSAKQKNAGETDKDENSGDGDDDDFNPTLAAMETEIKPKVLKTVNTFPLFLKNIRIFDLEDSVIPIVSSSASVAKGWNKNLGMVFIDGSHSLESASLDYESWESHIKNGGALVIHDIFEDPNLGGQAPYEIYKRALNDGYKLYERVDTIVCLTKDFQFAYR